MNKKTLFLIAKTVNKHVNALEAIANENKKTEFDIARATGLFIGNLADQLKSINSKIDINKFKSSCLYGVIKDSQLIKK